VGFVVDKLAMGQVFSEYFDFPCKFSFHQLLRTHNLPVGKVRPLVADVPSGHSLIPPHEIKKNVASVTHQV
jgi:hypothetical protein